MPLPSSNLQIAAEIYVLEQWLRRIGHATLMAKGGSSWPSCAPDDLLAKAKEEVNKLRRRAYLDAESSDNLIWALTLDQLRQLLTNRDLETFVFDLTGMARRVLDSQLVKLREVRNVVAHNRATSQRAVSDLEPVRDRLNAGISRFKVELLYPDPREDGSAPDAEAVFRESALYEPPYQGVRRLGRFDSFVAPFGRSNSRYQYIDIASLLDACHEFRQALLAIVLPSPKSGSEGDEFSVIWPHDVTREELESIRDFAVRIRGNSHTPYDDQDPQHICDPLIWFEGGWEGSAAAGGLGLEDVSGWTLEAPEDAASGEDGSDS